MSMTLPLLWMACAEWPDEPPPSPRDPPSVDTMVEAPSGPPLPQTVEGNRAPRFITLSVQPDKISTLDPARVVVETEDPDGDMVSVRLRWIIDGRKVPGLESRNLPPGSAYKGQKVVVEVEISDGLHTVSEETTPIIVGNAPPRFVTRPEQLRGDINGLQLQAEDPDRDRLVYSLEGGPPGLTVDAKGLLHFQPTVGGEGGRFEAMLKVTDSSGDYAGLPLTLNLSPGQPSRTTLGGR